MGGHVRRVAGCVAAEGAEAADGRSRERFDRVACVRRSGRGAGVLIAADAGVRGRAFQRGGCRNRRRDDAQREMVLLRSDEVVASASRLALSTTFSS